MKQAKDLYFDKWFDNTPYFCEYQPIIDSFGTVAVQVDDHDYQGDSRILYDNDGKIGYLQFGWGSCSGCDALQGCDTFEEVDKLIAELEADIKWFDDKAEAIEFFKTHDWEGDYSYDDEQRDFIEKSLEYLTRI